MTVRVEHLAEGVTLYCGDCREVLPDIGRVDCLVTDPPYGIGIAANPVRQRHEKKMWDDSVPLLRFSNPCEKCRMFKSSGAETISACLPLKIFSSGTRCSRRIFRWQCANTLGQI